MRIGIFKNPDLREWLQNAGMKEFVHRPFVVDDAEQARLEAEARAQHSEESTGKIWARGVGRALALKLSREKRSKETIEQAKTFKPALWDWGRIVDRVLRVLIIGLLLLIFLLGIPLRGEAQRRSLRVQWKDEGSILGTRGGGNLWIIDCTGAGLTCTISGATITIDGSAGSGAQHQVDGVNVTDNTTINFRDTTRILVANPSAGNIDFDIAAGGINALALLAAGLCGTTEILEDQGASWACIATPAGGAVRWDQLIDPTAVTVFNSNAIAELFQLNFTASYGATDVLVDIEQLTGNPLAGSVLFKLSAADPDVLLAQIGATNGVQITQAGALTTIGSGSVTATLGDSGVSFFLDQDAGTDLSANLEEESHASEHQNTGGDEVATATPAANAIPKADGSNKLAGGWISEVLY